MISDDSKFDKPLSPFLEHVVSSFYRDNSIVRHHTESFDHFLHVLIPRFINSSPALVYQNQADDGVSSYRCEVKFSDPVALSPRIIETDGKMRMTTPKECRLRNITYQSPLFVDLEEKVFKFCKDGKMMKDELISSSRERILLCWIPTVLHSSICNLSTNPSIAKKEECEYDQGGYLITKGSEKVILTQERMGNNQVFVFYNNKTKTIIAEMRSLDTKTCIVKLHYEPEKKFLGLTVELPNVKRKLPVFVVLKALGVLTDKELVERVCELSDHEMFQLLQYLIEDVFPIKTQEDALNFIGKNGSKVYSEKIKRIEFAESILEKELFPHLKLSNEEKEKLKKLQEEGELLQLRLDVAKDDETLKEKQQNEYMIRQTRHPKEKKILYGYMIRKLLQTVLKRRAFDDRDHYGNKRLDATGFLLFSIFKLSYLKVCKKTLDLMRTRIGNNHKHIQISRMIDPKIITKDLVWCLSTGNWGTNKNAVSRTGVSQVLSHFNYPSFLSHLRRISTPLSRNGTTTKPRQLHNSQWMLCCPVESPEGSATGLVKNMAISCHLSLEYPEQDMAELISPFIQSYDLFSNKVFVNGIPLGSIQKLGELYMTLKSYKRYGILPFDVGIVCDVKSQELRIQCDAGRCCHPVFVVSQNSLNEKEIMKCKTWNEMLRKGFIEYLDALEEEMALIAVFPKDLAHSYKSYTHCELHPSFLFGTCASLIPYSNFNQSPRNLYECAMIKQAVGLPAMNFQQRMDTMSHVLFYPQKPLVQTDNAKQLNYGEISTGQNVIVGICCYSG